MRQPLIDTRILASVFHAAAIGNAAQAAPGASASPTNQGRMAARNAKLAAKRKVANKIARHSRLINRRAHRWATT